MQVVIIPNSLTYSLSFLIPYIRNICESRIDLNIDIVRRKISSSTPSSHSNVEFVGAERGPLSSAYGMCIPDSFGVYRGLEILARVLLTT